MLDDLTTESTDRAVHSIAHSVIHLDQLAPIYGGERRRLRVVKCRGQSFRGGYHDFNIQPGGVAGLSAPGGRRTPHRLFRTSSCRAASPSSISSWAAASLPDRARSYSAPPVPGKSLLSLHYLSAAVGAGRARRIVRLRRRARSVVRARQGPRHRSRGDAERQEALHPADGRRGTVARRIFAAGPPMRRPRGDPHRRDRQPQRLSGVDAGRAIPDPASARAAAISQSPRRGDIPDRRAARHDR